MITTPNSQLVASTLRDIGRGASTEGDHVLGDLLRRGSGETTSGSLLRLA